MDNLNRFVLAHRRLIVAVLAGIAVWASISALSYKPELVTVPVAASDLPSGTTLRASDIALVQFNKASAPNQTLTKSELVAKTVAGPMRKGEAFTDFRAVNPRQLASGDQIALIDMSATSARLLRVGDLVDVIALDPNDGSQSHTLATAAPLTILDTPDDAVTVSVGVALPAEVAHEVMNQQLKNPLVVLPAAFP